MARIVWIASYPRSGNTWVRFLIANLLYKRITASSELQSFVPDVHEGSGVDHLYGGKTTYVKTHWKYDAQLPLRQDTVGAIYIIRHPLQVVVSNLNYFILRAGERYFHASEREKARMRTKYVEDFIAHGGAPEWLGHGMGTWPGNVATWVGNDVAFPTLVVRYEDMKSDPADFVARLCEFLSLKKTKEEVEAAVAASSFDSLRAMEEREVAQQISSLFSQRSFAASQAHGRHFMNEGRIDSYRRVLTPEQIEAARARFEPLAKHFGYAL